ncbi:MAG: hypothetical protein Q8O72_15335 [Bacteroidales bacterium]|nr:hypothetical protein [Bacteroidales bacterium]
MKKLILTLFIFGFVVQLSGQEIELFGHYSGSNYNKYQNNLGYGLGYYHITKSTNKIGFIFQHSFYDKEYSEIYPSSEDGISTYIKEIIPKNQRIAFKINYAFNVVKHLKSSLFIGPEIGINYFFINEQVTRFENKLIGAANYQSEYSVNNKFSFGFLMEFELKEIITERMSVSSSIHPEFIYYEKIGMTGGHAPTFIGCLNFNFGIKYKLKKD